MPSIRLLAFALISIAIALAQPLPAQDTAKQGPKKALKTPSAKKTQNKKGMVGLNPQPEPPSQARKGKVIRPGEMRGLNPQPEPPSQARKGKVIRPGEMRGLNPQPEPPSTPVK